MNMPARARNNAPAAPAQLPVAWEAARQTYALVGLNYKSVAKLGALPVVVIGGLQTLYSLYPTLINLALSLCGNLVATAIFAIGLNRLVMASQQNQLYRFRLGQRGFKYITLTLIALIPVLLMTMGIFALGFVLARLVASPNFGYVPLLLATVMGLSVASYTAVRFSVLLPAMYHDVAIDLHQVLRSTRGQAGTIWLGLLMTLAPILIVATLLLVVQIGYGPFPWVANLLQGFTLVSAVPLSIMFLAFNCHRYSQVTAPRRIKIVNKISVWEQLATATAGAVQHSAKAMRLTFYTIALFLAHLNSALGKLAPRPKPKPRAQARPVAKPRSYNRDTQTAPRRPVAKVGATATPRPATRPAAAPGSRPAPSTARPVPPRAANSNATAAAKRPAAQPAGVKKPVAAATAPARKPEPADDAPYRPANDFNQRLKAKPPAKTGS